MMKWYFRFDTQWWLQPAQRQRSQSGAGDAAASSSTATMGTRAPVRSSESSARHADPEPEAEPHCLRSQRTLSRNAPPSAVASLPGKSRSGYTRAPDPPAGAAADRAAECLAGAEAEEQDDEAEDEEGGHGLASTFIAATGACGLGRVGGERRRSSRRSARVDGIALSGRSSPARGRWGFRSAAAGAFP